MSKQNEISCMNDCIHLKACRRVQKIARENLGVKIPRYCTEKCGAYLSKDEVNDLVHVSDVMNYIYEGCDSIKAGYDPYDVYADFDLDQYIVDLDG